MYLNNLDYDLNSLEIFFSHSGCLLLTFTIYMKLYKIIALTLTKMKHKVLAIFLQEL